MLVSQTAFESEPRIIEAQTLTGYRPQTMTTQQARKTILIAFVLPISVGHIVGQIPKVLSRCDRLPKLLQPEKNKQMQVSSSDPYVHHCHLQNVSRSSQVTPKGAHRGWLAHGVSESSTTRCCSAHANALEEEPEGMNKDAKKNNRTQLTKQLKTQKHMTTLPTSNLSTKFTRQIP